MKLTKKAKEKIFDMIKTYPDEKESIMKELAVDPSLRKVKTIVEVTDEIRGNYLTVGAPFKFSAFEPEITRAPLLGEHSEEVLKELGYDAAAIASMKENQVI